MARQFDLFRTEGGVLVVVVQSDLLEAMTTRVVAPLLPLSSAPPPMRRLNPELSVGGETLVLMPQLLATLTLAELGRTKGSIAHMRDRIVGAIDVLLSGV